MKIPPVKGTRDFYPEEMAVHNWIVDGWKKASIRNGFEEYDDGYTADTSAQPSEGGEASPVRSGADY